MRKLTCTLALLSLLGGLLALPASAEAAPARSVDGTAAEGPAFEIPWLHVVRRALAWLLPFPPASDGGDEARWTAAASSTSTSTVTGTGTDPGDPGDQAGEVIGPDG